MFSSESVAGTSGPITMPPPLPAAEADVVVPPIQLEASPTIQAPVTETRRINEVTLPASVVLAWSLFVLAAIAMSFVAGLMIGHFLWRTIP